MAAARALTFPASAPSERMISVTRSDRSADPTADPAWATADDRTLVDACLAGHAAAFDVIVARHRRRVYRVCYRIVGNHEDASEVTQDVFLRAYRGFGSFKRESSVATWLYRIAVNASLNRVSRKTPETEPLPAREWPDPDREHPDESLLRAERAAEVRAAIARLPDKQRTTLILRVYHDLPHDQIAGILGSSVGAVKANFFHALANLKRLLERRGT
jgi:RNA polymerase sigma-70 factor, ECF subfamily